MQESAKAKQWREARGLSVQQLADLSGYAIETIYLFERGCTPRGTPITEWVWQRYRNVCAGIEAQIRSGANFQWGN